MTKGKRRKVVLIDGNSLLYRAFFAMPHFATLENQPTNAVYGFTMMLLRLVEKEKPDVLLVAFDAPAKTFRHEAYAEYKAHRKRAPDELTSQGPLAREVADAFRAPVLEVEGFEADDVVGTIARKAEARDYDVLIVTGDLDALQLVDPKVTVMTTVKGVSETIVYDEKAVEERYGLKPSQLADYKALKGDPSDNIPGVRGIGDKRAVKLIKEFGSLQNLLYDVEKVKESRIQNALISSSEQAELSKRLATIVTDVPVEIDLEKCAYREPDVKRLHEIFKRLEFKSLLKRLPEDARQREMTFAAAEEVGEYVTVRTKAALQGLLEEIPEAGSFGLRINGTPGRSVDAEAVDVAISTHPGKVYYVPLGESAITLDDLRPVLEAPSIRKCGHNLKYEYEILSKSGIGLSSPAFDVMLAAYLINPTRGAHLLEDVALDYAGIELPSPDPKTGKIVGPSGEWTREQLFAAQIDVVWRLVPILEAKLEEDGLQRLMNDVEMPLVPVLADIELAGIAVDRDWLNKLSKILDGGIKDLENQIYELAGAEFNIGSPKQLQTILFEKLGLPPVKKTKTGYSTDAESLAVLAPAHEIVAKILEYRELTKLKSTYADALPKLINPRTGRIHTSLNQAVTATGRLSSSEPNLQNIPIRTEIGREIRKAFIASRGNLLVSADYSQIELRILAHVSRDPELLRAFGENEDIHVRTAAKLFNVPPEEVGAEMRRQAKTVNFAVIYGMSDYGLSRELGIPTAMAKQYITSYFEQYPGVRRYATETLNRARLQGYVESLMGRRRYIPELNSANRVYREFAERAAVNMPIQGTAADIMKLAMINVCRRLREEGFTAKMVLQVHDELVFDVPESEVERLVPLVQETMEQAFEMDVPLEAEVRVGKDWCTAQPVSAVNHEEVGA